MSKDEATTDLQDRLKAALAAADPQALAAVATDIDRHVFDQGAFPQPLFDGVLAALGDPAWQRWPDSLALVKMFEYELDLLGDAQRAALSAALLAALPRLADETSAFLAAEMVVEIGPPASALPPLVALARQAPPDRLPVVVHGLDWLAKRAAGEPPAAAALDALRTLARHRVPAVASEAAAALARRTRA